MVIGLKPKCFLEVLRSRSIHGNTVSRATGFRRRKNRSPNSDGPFPLDI